MLTALPHHANIFTVDYQIKQAQLSMKKDPTNTFIGGITIGLILGALIGAVIEGQHLLHVLNHL